MGKKTKKTKKTDLSGETSAGFGNVFGDLLAARGLAPAQASAPTETPPETRTKDGAGAFSWAAHARLRVRLHKKGRGGKKVTRIEGVTFEGNAGRAPAKALGKALGCRAFVEAGELLVQGDQRQRLVTYLVARGVKRVDPC